MGDQITRAARRMSHGMRVVPTSLHALPKYGLSVVNDHCNIRGCKFRYIAAFMGGRLVRGPSFSLRGDTVFSFAANGCRSVARALGKRTRRDCGHCPRVVRSKKLRFGCAWADANWLL